MEIERFFAELASRMEAVRRKDRTKYRRFFAEMAPRLDTARALEAELDRHLARRFNVFDYAKTDELGISRILADLLDPDGPHGQGTLFLETFVEGFEKLLFRPKLSVGPISVITEEIITASRRIDIYVKIGYGDAAQCLAIENKPFARDQENQVNDYLIFLEKRFKERFVLIYLSPKGEVPSDRSIPEEELEKWKGRFAILPFCTVTSERKQDAMENQPDIFEGFRLSFSLAEWFQKCRRVCEVDRLRWFLRDAEIYCLRTFGGQTMTEDCGTQAVRDFLLSRTSSVETACKNLAIARKVSEAWPAVREDICNKFLNRICSSVKSRAKDMSEFTDDLRVECRFGSDRNEENCLWLYRTSWSRYKVKEPSVFKRTAICLRAETREAKKWWYGVASPLSINQMTANEKIRCERLRKKFKKSIVGYNQDQWTPLWRWVDKKYINWENLSPKLYEECERNDDGKITDYFVTLLVETAKEAIPIIDGIEGDRA